MVCATLDDKTYSRLNLEKPNNSKMAKPRMKEDRDERRKYPSITHSLKN